ncbi:MAG TPA: TetR/AcrR family transcriptional regulator [Anaerolineaceae bacterium]|nr:TetR/AcrR family transcriptional regulator [Anaerolineaceae bacterium]HPN51971.1 TetR/AcrR family transcriptional regulator [Anaerolineaceae bacterium]
MRKKIELNLIYQAALENFSRYGLRKTTLDDIAADLGVTKSNLYRYTKNKETLYHEAVAYAMRQWQERVKKALVGVDSPKEQFLILCHKAFAYLAEDKIFCAILKNDPDIFPMFPVQDEYGEINRESVVLLETILKNGIEQGVFRPMETSHIAAVIFSIYKMFIIQTYIRTDDQFVEQVFIQTVDLLTQGIFLSNPPS